MPLTRASFACSCLALVLWTSAPTARAQDGVSCGDANGDGLVNTTDARLVQRCAVGQIPCAAGCDVNGDGRCNTTDARLIQRAAVGQLPVSQFTCVEPVRATFSAGGSRIEEGQSASLRIVFDAPYAGTLRYRVTGTAGPSDFALGDACTLSAGDQECLTSVSGPQAELIVEAVDDLDPSGVLEGMEWLSFELLPGPGYTVGALAQHVLTIENNDAVWEGIFSSEGEEIPFSLEIQREGGRATAALVSDGVGPIPAGRTELGVIDFDLGAETFQLALPAMPLAGGERLLRAETHLILELHATADTGLVSGRRIEGARQLGSASVARFVYPDSPHFDRSVPGSFVLQLRPTATSD